MNGFENVPTDWDDARDESFFRIVCQLFTPHYLEAGTILLSANDPEPAASR
jgi:hypothetical protein